MSAPGRTLATVTAAQVLNVASSTVVAVALPSIGRDLAADGTAQQWVVDAFVLVFASLLIAGGTVGDRLGHRRALLAGLTLFALGSLWCAFAPTVEWLVAGRVVQALGPPLTLPASLALVTEAYTDPKARARAIGIWGAGSGTGLALGPLVGGLIVDALGWRWVFGINVPICAALVAFILTGIPARRPARAGAPPDVRGAVLLTAAVAALVFGLIEGRDLGWGSAPVLGALAGAVVLGALSTRRWARHPAPLVDLTLLRERRFAGANLGAAVLYGALTGSAVYVSVFLQSVQDRSALEAGLVLLPQGALTAAFAPVAGRLTASVGARVPIAAGMAIATAGFLALLRLEPGTSLPATCWAFGLLGIGTGLALPPMTAVALSSARAGAAGMASAIHQASRQLGQTFAVAVLGTIVLSHGDLVAGLHRALLVAAVAIAVAGVAVTRMVRPRPSPALASPASASGPTPAP